MAHLFESQEITSGCAKMDRYQDPWSIAGFA
jgi:hypothetical protein